MNKLPVLVGLLILLCSFRPVSECLVEAEQFSNHGGWTLTPQYMDQMGSPYLQAHGLGKPVEDATTQLTLPSKGTYYVYVRTYNWTAPWTSQPGAGQFVVKVNGEVLENTLGATGNQWMWQYAGSFKAKTTAVSLALTDMSGFDGRCDAVYLTQSRHPDLSDTPAMRLRLDPPKMVERGTYDFVVVGGGLAGMCAAVTAARLGLKVALIHDRSVLGGNNSSEIRVQTGGVACTGLYPNLGMMIREFGHANVNNAHVDGASYCDSLKAAFAAAEPNLTVFYNEHVNAVEMNHQLIRSVKSQNTRTGTISTFSAPLFADCTGDANLGYLAGADYRVGREARSETEEPSAVEVADRQVMGASVLWNSIKKESTFPLFEYGVTFTDESVIAKNNSTWKWETGMNRDQVAEAEYIRDYGMLVAYSNWSYLKNRYKEKDKFSNRTLNWVASVAGKRESRRLMGDYILSENDILNEVSFPDASVAATWSIDLHYPDTNNSKYFPGQEFISYCVQQQIPIYAIPYRCFYSRNVENLFMAGRDISVTHAALGTVRVMRTTAMMGEVVGLAATVCHHHASKPRSVYTDYLPELQLLMQKGAGKPGLPDNQNFSSGRKEKK